MQHHVCVWRTSPAAPIQPSCDKRTWPRRLLIYRRYSPSVTNFARRTHNSTPSAGGQAAARGQTPPNDFVYITRRLILFTRAARVQGRARAVVLGHGRLRARLLCATVLQDRCYIPAWRRSVTLFSVVVPERLRRRRILYNMLDVLERYCDANQLPLVVRPVLELAMQQACAARGYTARPCFSFYRLPT